jgi:hypothetical protein
MKRLLTLFAALLFFCGCGDSKKELDPAIKKQFTDGIAAYCSSKSMGMKVKSFQSADIKGDKATVVCKMEEAGGLYKMAPRWTFKFTRKNGKWIASEHTTK